VWTQTRLRRAPLRRLPHRPLCSPHTTRRAQLENRFYVQRQLDEEERRAIQERTQQSEREHRQTRVKHASMDELAKGAQKSSQATTAAVEEKQGGKRKKAPTAAASSSADGDGTDDKPKAKRKYTKKQPQMLTPVQRNALLTPKAPMTPGVASSPSDHQHQQQASPSPSMARSPAPSAGLSGGSTGTASTLSKPRLTRSPSTAALPSSSTSGEKLRTRVAHFLAAQEHGLGMATLVARLGVSIGELKPILASLARYEAPGFYRLRPEVYSELRLDEWADCGPEDRRRVADKMLRAQIPLPDAWRKYASEMAVAEAAAAAATGQQDSVVGPPLSEPTLPPLPELSHLPDALPPHLLVTAPVPASSAGSDAALSTQQQQQQQQQQLAPPRTFASYAEYLELHAEFLRLFRSYRLLGASGGVGGGVGRPARASGCRQRGAARGAGEARGCFVQKHAYAVPAQARRAPSSPCGAQAVPARLC